MCPSHLIYIKAQCEMVGSLDDGLVNCEWIVILAFKGKQMEYLPIVQVRTNKIFQTTIPLDFKRNSA